MRSLASLYESRACSPRNFDPSAKRLLQQYLPKADKTIQWGHAHAPEPKRAQRSALAAARAGGNCRGGFAALLGRHHRAGVRAGARAVLDRRRFHLRDGARHRDHGRISRRAGGGRFAGGWRSASRAPACCSCAAWRLRPPMLIIVFGVALLAGYNGERADDGRLMIAVSHVVTHFLGT